MKYTPKNTLAYFAQSPQGMAIDLSKIPVKNFGAATKKYRETCGTNQPENEAMKFYALNHLAAIVKKTFTKNEPLPAWALAVMLAYSKELTEQSKRMGFYIMSITTREMRHLLDNTTATCWSDMEKACGKEMVAFIKMIQNCNENQAVDKFMKAPPDATIEQYMKAMSIGFHKGKWSGGFGGHPWGNVADCSLAMVKGETSMETMVDTGYTLAHNNGPIFNKGMMYDTYGGHFINILDVQRAGQVCEFYLDSQKYGFMFPLEAEVKDLIVAVRNEQPAEFKGFVDWQLVNDLRPDKSSYSSKYKTVLDKYKKFHPAGAVAPKPITIGGKPVKAGNEWTMYPGVTIPTFVRVA